eukprot:SAG11_NODE_2339_length_3498_cov_2.635882_3_plen_216_part_00
MWSVTASSPNAPFSTSTHKILETVELIMSTCQKIRSAQEVEPSLAQIAQLAEHLKVECTFDSQPAQMVKVEGGNFALKKMEKTRNPALEHVPEFVIVDQGRCTDNPSLSYITDKATCSRGAAAVGWLDTEVGDRSDFQGNRAPGCLGYGSDGHSIYLNTRADGQAPLAPGFDGTCHSSYGKWSKFCLCLNTRFDQGERLECCSTWCPSDHGADNE